MSMHNLFKSSGKSKEGKTQKKKNAQKVYDAGKRYFDEWSTIQSIKSLALRNKALFSYFEKMHDDPEAAPYLELIKTKLALASENLEFLLCCFDFKKNSTSEQWRKLYDGFIVDPNEESSSEEEPTTEPKPSPDLKTLFLSRRPSSRTIPSFLMSREQTVSNFKEINIDSGQRKLLKKLNKLIAVLHENNEAIKLDSILLDVKVGGQCTATQLLDDAALHLIGLLHDKSDVIFYTFDELMKEAIEQGAKEEKKEKKEKKKEKESKDEKKTEEKEEKKSKEPEKKEPENKGEEKKSHHSFGRKK